MHNNTTKCCTICKQSKELTEFYYNRTKRQGKADQCVICYKASNYGKVLLCDLCKCEFSIKHRNIAKRKHLKCNKCIRKILADKAINENLYVMDNGYKRNCRHGKYQHRTVMEAHLGRELLKSEIIHHIDGNKFNNELNNLWLTNHSSHTKAHHTLEKIALQLYRQGFVEFDVTSGEYRLPKK